jgi:prephenate dehydrogenase
VQWNKVTLVGVGLLGGSLGMALKERRLARFVYGFVRRPASVRECERLEAVDKATVELEEAVADADLVVLCTPIFQMRALVQRMLPWLRPGALLTDVGSVKGSVVSEIELLAAKGKANFVGSHPMAGGEKMGVAAARSDLYLDAVCIVTPTRKTNKDALRQTEELWKGVGSRVVQMTPQEHDELVSRTSHLPHVTAAVLASFVLNPKYPAKQSLVCANGFRDTTRVASGSPEMWRDIALANRKNLLRAVENYVSEMRRFATILKSKDERRLSRYFEAAKERRDSWAEKMRSATPE